MKKLTLKNHGEILVYISNDFNEVILIIHFKRYIFNLLKYN